MFKLAQDSNAFPDDVSKSNNPQSDMKHVYIDFYCI